MLCKPELAAQLRLRLTFSVAVWDSQVRNRGDDSGRGNANGWDSGVDVNRLEFSTSE